MKTNSRQGLLRFAAVALLAIVAGWQFFPLRSQMAAGRLPTLDASQTAWIGERIFANECNLKLPCLTSWNAGEDFPSLGIGHFIWYREGQQEAFVESFPALLAWYQQKSVPVPAWLNELPGQSSPWPDRAAFQRDFDSARMVELRNFLAQTMPVQAEFIINRLYSSVPALRQASQRPDEVEALFYRIADSELPVGIYALIDYVNFKGEGTAPAERYRGEGWGLLQVLEHVLQRPDHASRALLEQFADSAKYILARRVANAPPERGEERWTAGWNKRMDTYTAPHTVH